MKYLYFYIYAGLIALVLCAGALSCKDAVPKKNSTPPQPSAGQNAVTTDPCAGVAVPTATGAPSSSPSTAYPEATATPLQSSSPVTSSNPCGGSSASGDILNPAKLRECHAQGLIYDRDSKVKDCIQATLEPAWCTDANAIGAKFDEKARAGAAINASLQPLISQGYKLDQCGITKATGMPVVFLYKLINDNQIETKKFDAVAP